MKEQYSIIKTITFLHHFNKWRRGAELPQPHPEHIGIAIDSAIAHLKSIAKNNKIKQTKENAK